LNLFDVIRKEQKPLIIVTSHAHKVGILRRLSDEKIVRPLQFLTPRDLFEKVFFKPKPEMIHFLSNHYGKKESIIEAWLEYLPEIRTDITYASGRLKHLQAMKILIHEQDLIQKNPFDNLQFKRKRMVVYGDFSDPVVVSRLTRLQDSLGFDWIHPQARSGDTHDTHTLSVHEDIEQEIVACAIRMLKLVEQGVSLEAIKLHEPPADYHPMIKEIFTHFNLPVTLNTHQTLISHPKAQAFLREFSHQTTTDYFRALEKTFAIMEEKNGPDGVLVKIKNVVNPTVRYLKETHNASKHLEHLFKEATVIEPARSPAITPLGLDQVDPEQIHTLFILGMNTGNHPRYREESDYLSAEEKALIGYPPVEQVNRKLRNAYLIGLRKVGRLACSYAKNDASGPLEPSDILNDMRLQPIDPVSLSDQTFSESYDKIRIKKHKDAFDAYGTIHEDLPKLHARFRENYNRYDNRFTGLDPGTLQSLLKRKQLSVTRVESFFKCQFRFFLEHFLKISGDENRLALDRGNLFHRALEDRTITKTDLTEYVHKMLDENPDASEKERYFLEKAIDEALFIRDLVYGQETRSGFEVTVREAGHEMPIEHGFYLKGKIDKIMRENDDIVLIDYKTGQTTLNMKTAYHGIGGQLLYYALLYRAHDNKVKFTGLYEQTLMPRNIRKEPGKTKTELIEEALRLQGTTTKNLDVLARFDPGFDGEDTLVDKLNLKKDGTYKKTVKAHDDADMDAMLDHLLRQLKTAVDRMNKGDFSINPKQQGKENLSCKYCPFNDVCFKTPRDFVHLDNFKDQQDVFETIRKGSD